MCIRDRFPAGEARDVLYRGREAFVAALKGFSQADQDTLVNACHIQSETFKGLMDALDFGWLHVPQREHCLLYTSDAADERSSVDLGGRRIIQKKKRKKKQKNRRSEWSRKGDRRNRVEERESVLI